MLNHRLHFFQVLALCVSAMFALNAFSAQNNTREAGDVKQPHAVAIFAGGCFWCLEKPFDVLDGVVSTVSGYIGGNQGTATYPLVSSGSTKHYEAIKIEYDPRRVSYDTLLAVFWRNIDPFDAKGQFCDKGEQYLSAIFYLDDAQRLLAEKSVENAQTQLNRIHTATIVTPIIAATPFYKAEGYHQNYYKRNPIRYKYYRTRCGRDRRLDAVWGDIK